MMVINNEPLEIHTEMYHKPKVLCYKLEGRWFDLRWCHWNFSL